jgi:hypothetical protein
MQRAGPLTKQLNVTDRGVISLAEGCSELRVLSLGGCYKITTSAIRYVAFLALLVKKYHRLLRLEPKLRSLSEGILLRYI